MNRKQRDANRRTAELLKLPLSYVCSNCGNTGAHYVPPSFGQEGFFICEQKNIWKKE